MTVVQAKSLPCVPGRRKGQPPGTDQPASCGKASRPWQGKRQGHPGGEKPSEPFRRKQKEKAREAKKIHLKNYIKKKSEKKKKEPNTSGKPNKKKQNNKWNTKRKQRKPMQYQGKAKDSKKERGRKIG